jgi:hypothetical protein
MSGDARDFNSIETRAVSSFFSARQGTEGNSRNSDRNFRGTCTILCHRRKLNDPDLRGDFSTCDAPRPGRPKTVTTPEIIDQIHELILEESRISTKSISEQLKISRKRFGSIIHEDFDMRKLSANLVPKFLIADEKRQSCHSSAQNLIFWHDPNDFLSRLVNMDEFRLYHYEPETKQQSMKWRHSGLTHPENS